MPTRVLRRIGVALRDEPAAELGLGALAAMATAGLFSLLLTWWSGPVDTAVPLEKGNSITFVRLGSALVLAGFCFWWIRRRRLG